MPKTTPNDTYSFQLGDFHCIVIKDEGSKGPVEQFFPNASPELLERAHKEFGDTLDLSFNCLLVETPSESILIDTGNGVDTDGKGRLFQNLKSINVPPENISKVILTHAHADHYAAMLTKQGQKIFPNATYLMWHDEWKHYSSPAQLKKDKERSQERYDFIKTYFLKLEPHLHFLSAQHPNISEGIKVLYLPGHTKHHIGIKIQSEGECLLYLADLFIHPLIFNFTSLLMPFDDNKDIIQSRQKILERATNSSELILGYHFSFPGLGFIKQDSEGYYWQTIKSP